MKGKNTAEVEVPAVKLAPTAAKPLSKPVTKVGAAKPVAKAAVAKPVVKAAPAVKDVAKAAPATKAAVAKSVVKVTPAVNDVAKPAAKAAPMVKSEKDDKTEKESKSIKKIKLKVVRDSFTMPQNEYQKISDIKSICFKAGLQVKKSEVLRAGVIALCAMSDEQLNKAMSDLDKIKTGRPNKH
ncbi:MAG: hypothetical protein R8K48_09735 [Gallionella sp.]